MATTTLDELKKQMTDQYRYSVTLNLIKGRGALLMSRDHLGTQTQRLTYFKDRSFNYFKISDSHVSGRSLVEVDAEKNPELGDKIHQIELKSVANSLLTRYGVELPEQERNMHLEEITNYATEISEKAEGVEDLSYGDTKSVSRFFDSFTLGVPSFLASLKLDTLYQQYIGWGVVKQTTRDCADKLQKEADVAKKYEKDDFVKAFEELSLFYSQISEQAEIAEQGMKFLVEDAERKYSARGFDLARDDIDEMSGMILERIRSSKCLEKDAPKW